MPTIHDYFIVPLFTDTDRHIIQGYYCYCVCRTFLVVLHLMQSYHWVCNQINTTGVTSGAGTAYPSGAPEFIPGFQWGSCYSIFSFICMFVDRCLSFFFWPLCCLFFFDIQILITPLVSSNSSYKFVKYRACWEKRQLQLTTK